MAKANVDKTNVVYILTNPCFDEVKVGITGDIDERLRTLNTGVPRRFRVHATYELQDEKEMREIEKLVHEFFSEHRITDEFDGKKTEKDDFFNIEPEKIYELLKFASKIRKDSEKLTLGKQPTKEEIIESIQGEKATRKPRLSMSELGIKDGDTLKFVKDETIICIADVGSNKVLYEEELYSATGLAKKLLKEKCGQVVNEINGWLYFKYNGKTLAEIREELEKEASEK